MVMFKKNFDQMAEFHKENMFVVLYFEFLSELNELFQIMGMLLPEEYYRLGQLYKESETRGLPFEDLLPKTEIKIKATEDMGRKDLYISFSEDFFGGLKLQVRFSIEKKRRLVRNLVELSAEVVGQHVEEAELEHLELPEILKGVVQEKIIDSNWVGIK